MKVRAITILRVLCYNANMHINRLQRFVINDYTTQVKFKTMNGKSRIFTDLKWVSKIRTNSWLESLPNRYRAL